MSYSWRNEPTTRDAIDGYVAALLDRGHLRVRRSKRTGNWSRVFLRLSEADDWAEEQFKDIVSNYDLSDQAVIDKIDIRPTRPQEYRRLSWRLTIKDPVDILKVLRPCSRFMRKKEKANDAMEACNYLISKNRSQPEGGC